MSGPPWRSEDAGLPASTLEEVACYGCGGAPYDEFIRAEDDLTGKPGTFRFVRCRGCDLVYQNPRVRLDHIKAYYDDDYIAHRKRRDWGPLTPLFDRAMSRHDRDKDAIVRKYIALSPVSEVLDVGCGAGTFLTRMREEYGARVTGVDFKDLSTSPGFDPAIELHCGLFYEVPLLAERFDLITMWHFLEHDYDPIRSLETAKRALRDAGRIVIEVPRLDSATFQLYRERWPGLQAPQHTVLFDKDALLGFVEKAGLRVVDYLPYGAFPAYFYLFAGAAFKLLRGRGLNVEKALLPYFLGQIALAPLLAFEERLNLAMQTVVCARD